MRSPLRRGLNTDETRKPAFSVFNPWFTNLRGLPK